MNRICTIQSEIGNGNSDVLENFVHQEELNSEEMSDTETLIEDKEIKLFY